MLTKVFPRWVWVAAFLSLTLLAETVPTAHLRILVLDSSGHALHSTCLLTAPGELPHRFTGGSPVSLSLPAGTWTLTVSSAGFRSQSRRLTLRPGQTRSVPIRLSLASVSVVTTVQASSISSGIPTATVEKVTLRSLRDTQPAQIGRGVIGLVDSQPGWLLEANGVLHPRESEYDTQYQLNGIPLLENRSPAYAPPLNLLALHSLSVQTAGYPAADGRKLGGVIDVSTVQPSRPGLHGIVRVSAGSFSTFGTDLLLQQQVGANTFSFTGQGAHTSRYLDPPVIQNFTNRDEVRSAGLTWTRDSEWNHLLLYGRAASSNGLVPNEAVQQDAGQRQDRHLDEQIGQLSWQHVLSSDWVAALHGMVQVQKFQLSSNPASTPMRVAANRSRRLLYLSSGLSGTLPDQRLSFGADLLSASLQEQLDATVTDPSYFDPGTPASIAFLAHHPDQEQAVWAGDRFQFHSLTFDAGLRWDRYALLVRQTGWSPRLALAWRSSLTSTALHASWDRTFETPASENILLASSPLAWSLTHATTGLVLHPSRGNFYETGIEQALPHGFDLDANWFLRTYDNFFDDDLLFDTGVSFPISFAGARIQGTEVHLALPVWGRFSGFANWTNQIGTAWNPITGGLFLDPNAASLLHAHDRFPVSQDQRNTVRVRVRAGLVRHWWSALEYRFGSGLPTDTSQTAAQLIPAYGAAIVSRVNFARGRIDPSNTFDLSLGGPLWQAGDRTLTLQASVLNLANSLNVIDFAGLFSGTAIAPPRSWHLSLTMGF